MEGVRFDFLQHNPINFDDEWSRSANDVIKPDKSKFVSASGRIISVEDEIRPSIATGKRTCNESGIGDGQNRQDVDSRVCKRLKLESENNSALADRTIKHCVQNVENYQQWLNSQPENVLSCPPLVQYGHFIPQIDASLLVYDGVNIHVNTQGLMPDSVVALEKIKQMVKPPRLCSACPTPQLAGAVLSILPSYRKTAIFVPMAGAGRLAAMIEQEVKKENHIVHVFSYDISPRNSLVSVASVGERGVNRGDSFQQFYHDAATVEASNSMPTLANENPDYTFNHFVMLLDFPQFYRVNPENCPLQIAVEKFMRFTTPKSKQIIYWGIGDAVVGEKVVNNPFKQVVSVYNKQAKEKWNGKQLEIKDAVVEYPRTFSNEVLQQVYSEISVPLAKKEKKEK